MAHHDQNPSCVVVLGAGLTGLSCAYHLGDAIRVRLIERHATKVGGLAKTIARPGGFMCDGTGHWLHLRTPEMGAFVRDLLAGNLQEHERRARIFSHACFTYYPFQANTFGLPREIIAECVLGIIAAKFEEASRGPPQNYKEWIRKEFGEGICRHFMDPYNRKIYGVPLESLAADFAAKYIPRPSIEAVVKGALGLSSEALGYNAKFVYPKRGGMGALSEAIHSRLSIRAELGREPRAIDLATCQVTMADGEVISFSWLVNTIPLPQLISLCVAGNASMVPASIQDHARLLRANVLTYFDVGIRGDPTEHQNYHWVYLPEPEFAFYRVGSYSAVEPSMAPAGYRSYYVEFGGRTESASTQDLEQPLIDGLTRLGILSRPDDLVFATSNTISPAYVLFDANYTESRRAILDWLDATPVISVGRYGRWQYNAMEDALLEGKEAAERIQARG